MTGSGGVVRRLDRHQVPLYLLAITAGALVGVHVPPVAPVLERALTPVLMVLLYVTFLTVPLTRLRQAARDRRFLAALLTLNFLVVPPVAYGLSRFVAADDALVLGVLLVLLTPCVDYVIVFSGLAGAAHERLVVATPVLMVLQLLLLPAYLWLMLGPGLATVVRAGPFVQALVLLVIVPLALAAATQLVARRGEAAARVARGLPRAMVPLLMLTLAVVVGSQVHAVAGALGRLTAVVPLYVAFLVVMPALGLAVARFFGQGPATARATVFSGATRNSLVVLPLALASPEPLVPLVVVTQTMVELLGMVLYVRLVPALLPSPAR